MKAVILAAGMGSRLQAILRGSPKPLLKVGGKSLLERSLDAISKTNLGEVLLATGYNAEEVYQRVGKTHGKLKITHRINPQFSATGSMHSLYLALGNPQDCIVLDGDIIYDPQILPEVIGNPKDNLVLLTDCCGSGDEVFVTLDPRGNVNYLGKPKPSSPTQYEFTGISRFSARFMEKMFEIHEGNMRRELKSDYYEDCAFKAGQEVPWAGFFKPGLLWAEIDTPENFKTVNDKLLPRLRDKE